MDFTHTCKKPGKELFFDLFETTGWNKEYCLSPDELYIALENSWYSLFYYSGERLVGCGRIISDGTCHALILDMIVHPDFQGKGIGGKILEDLVAECKKHNLRDIQLFCAKGKIGFYEKYNFISRPEDAPGMELKDKFGNI